MDGTLILEDDFTLGLNPKEAMPVEPVSVLYANKELSESLSEYSGSEYFTPFSAAFLSTILHYGEYNKATKYEQPRNTPQYKADTVHIPTLQTLAFLLPEFAERAKYYPKAKRSNPQATLIVAGETNDLFKKVAEVSSDADLVLSGALEQDDLYTNFALLSGIVATGRGAIRVVEPTVKHDPAGDVRIQFDFNENSVLHQILYKISPDSISQIKGRVSLRFNICGDNAVEMCKSLLEICPPLAIIRPELLLLVEQYGVESPSQLFENYKTLMGPFYHPRK